MKKLAFLFIFLVVGGALLGTYYVGQYTEQKSKEILLTLNNDEMHIKLLSYKRHFFSANVVTQITFIDKNLKKITVKVLTKIYHYPYKAVSVNKLIFLDQGVNETLKNYFTNKDWFNLTGEFSLLGTLKGKLSIPLGSYNKKGEVLKSQPMIMSYKIDLNNKTGHLNLFCGGGTLKTYNDKISLQNVVISSSFSDATLKRSVKTYNYTLRIAKLLQHNPQKNTVILAFKNITLHGGSENGSEKSLINTHNELTIARWQLGNNEKLQFLNSHLKVNITELYRPALNRLSTDTQSTPQEKSALATLINHGFIFSLSKFSSDTPWGNINGYLNFNLSKGAALSKLVKNPYSLFDYSQGETKLSLPLVFLKFPRIENYLAFGFKNNFLKREDQNIVFEGSYRQGELIVNGHEIVL